MESQEKRINYVTAILGGRGTGKTTYTVKLIEHYQLTRPEMKILLCDNNDHPLFRHIPIIQPELLERWISPSIYRIVGRSEQILPPISKYLYNCLIIFEDSTKYVNKNIQKEVRNFVLDSKQKNLDLVFQFHGFHAIPPELLKYMDILTLFKCDNPERRKDSIMEYDDVVNVWNRVMKHKSKYYNESVIIF